MLDFPATMPQECEDRVLLNEWYPVGYSTDFVHGEVYKTTLLERDLVIWRDAEGEAHVWEDLCIHRGARLTRGFIRDNKLVCPYHGWRYDGEAKCTLMPAAPDETPMKKARAFPYPVREVYGMVWTSLGDEPGVLPDFPEWDNPAYQKVHCNSYVFNSSGFRAVENTVDATHFPFVHAGINGVTDRPDAIIPYHVETDETGVHSSEVRVFQPFGDARGIPIIAYYAYRCIRPLTCYFMKRMVEANEQGEEISNESQFFSHFVPVQPISATQCIVRGIIATASNPQPSPEAIRARADMIFAQDREVVESQRPERIPTHLRYELHHRTDLMGQRYRNWLRDLGITYGVI